jgi:hypothetical protein
LQYLCNGILRYCQNLSINFALTATLLWVSTLMLCSTASAQQGRSLPSVVSGL